MELAFKQRMLGAIFILSLGVILIPVLFDTPHVETKNAIHKPQVPDMPDTASVNEINYIFNDLESNFNQATVTSAEQKPVEHSSVAVAQVESEPMTSSSVLIEPVLDQQSPVTEPDNVQVPIEKPKPHAPALAKTSVAAVSKTLDKATGEWTIQLGAFSSRQNASVLLKKLTRQGFESYLKDDKQRNIVRVFVAPGVNHDNAQILLTKLDKELGIKGMIVRFNND